jgi:glycosyltransferase involved in cell wall biosynthesis
MPNKKFNNVSVCIPARNEEKNIESLIKLVLPLLGDGSEIIIGLNGCTDNTEQIVEKFAQSNRGLKTVKSEPGKAYAVNALMSVSQNNILLFLDSDVEFEQEAPIALISFLRSTDNVAVCADIQRIIKSTNSFIYKIQKLWNMPLRTSTEMGLMGAMYALKKQEFIQELHEKGYSEIPPIINEDHFTHLILENKVRGDKKWSNLPQAVVSFRPSNILDTYKRAKRIIKGDLQLIYEHTSLGLRIDEVKGISPTGKFETPKERKQRRIQMFNDLSLDEKLLMIIIYPLRRVILFFVWNMATHEAMKEYQKKKNMQSWVPTQSDR